MKTRAFKLTDYSCLFHPKKQVGGAFLCDFKMHKSGSAILKLVSNYALSNFPYAISKLHKFANCTEHAIYTCTVDHVNCLSVIRSTSVDRQTPWVTPWKFTVGGLSTTYIIRIRNVVLAVQGTSLRCMFASLSRKILISPWYRLCFLFSTAKKASKASLERDAKNKYDKEENTEY